MRRATTWCLVLAVGVCATSGCKSAATVERERRDSVHLSRTDRLEDGMRRMEMAFQSLEHTVQLTQDSSDRAQQRVARLEQESSDRVARRLAQLEAAVARPTKPIQARDMESRSDTLPAEGSDQDADAARVQAALKRVGYDPGPVDGKMGQRTRRAVMAFQKDHGLKIDGVVGSLTMARLRP